MCLLPGGFDLLPLQLDMGTVVIARPLDAEVQSVYNMMVQVTDGTNIATAQVHLDTHTHARARTHTETQGWTHIDTYTQVCTHKETHLHTQGMHTQNNKHIWL